jgi:threonine dehydratase
MPRMDHPPSGAAATEPAANGATNPARSPPTDTARPGRLPGLDDVRRAHHRLRPHVHRTPLLSCRSLEAAHGARLRLKAENLQRGGSFKIRGALNALLEARRRAETGKAGIITYSSGNHGQAVALASRIVGCEATILVPEDISRVKKEAIEGYGGRVVTCGLTSEDRREGAIRLAGETGGKIIPPYDDPDVMAGQGTVALEILEELGDLEVILVPVGGGGLISGIAIAAKALRPGIQVLGVEPETANDTALSLARGERVRIPAPRTIADGLRAVIPGELTFEVVRKRVDGIRLVSDDAIREAQKLLLERAKLLVEPSGAAAMAAYLQHGRELSGRTVAVVLSGGNVNLEEGGLFS